MTTDTSFLSYIMDASFVVKCVILLLASASIASWTVIAERVRYYKKQWTETKQFEQRFWSGIALNELYQSTQHEPALMGVAKIFSSGFKAFTQFQATGKHSRDDVISGAQRAMQIAESKSIDELEQPLSLLATVGSVSPFIGLFGTVWGIMTVLQTLGGTQQASIAMVAPGISEALVTTAIGLFTAIPAVIAFNRFNKQVAKLENYYETFSAINKYFAQASQQRDNAYMKIEMKGKKLRRRPLSEINVVPYIDVMLVLVVILMITAPLLTQGVHVNLPQASAKAMPQKDKPIIVSVDQQGNFYLNTSATPTQKITPQDLMSDVSAELQTAQTQNKKQDIYVKGDRNVNYGAVMQAMVLLQKAGADDIGLITKNPPPALKEKP